MEDLGFFDFASLLLLLAAAIGVVNERSVGLPRPIALLVGSLALSMVLLLLDRFAGVPVVSWLGRSLVEADLPHVFLDGALSFLLFAGALQVNLRDLRQRKWIILSLSTVGVIVATAAFAFGLFAICAAVGPPIPLAWCAVLGAILAPTDAVVVQARMSRLPLPRGLRATIAGESLFNDGAGVVMFFVTLAIAGGETGLIGHGYVLEQLVLAMIGGAAVGGACGFLAERALRGTREPAVRLTISLALAAGSYRLADAAGVSGPIAVVTAGLMLATGAAASAGGARAGPHQAVAAFWSLLDELLNAVLFLLLGLLVHALSIPAADLPPMLLAIPLAIGSRFVSVVVPVAWRADSLRAAARSLAVMTWSGLRGGVSVALALTLPPSPYRGELLAICYVVVVFTIVVQGLTIERVLRRLYGAPVGGAQPEAR